MKQSISRAELMESFKELEAKFTECQRDVSEKDAKFEQARSDLKQALEASSKSIILPKENPLTPLLGNFIKKVSEINKTWDNKVAGREKGNKFREKFGDSLLVFVFGKVKSGKSSLSNYMAWGYSEPTEGQKNSNPIKPAFFSEERAEGVASGDLHKHAEEKKEFRVGATEATSTIQGFKLPGITWVDSPGLHSVTKANEDLTKEYVEHADLIIYAMNSSAPARKSDMEELKSLLEKNKKVVVIITACDTTEEDEDDDGNIVSVLTMKPEKDKKDQIELVTNELKQLTNHSRITTEITPISVRYAEQNQANPDSYKESGVGVFCADLKDLIECDGVKEKQQVPMNNFKGFTQSVIADALPLNELIKDFKVTIADVKKKQESLLLQESSILVSKMNETILSSFEAIDEEEHADAIKNSIKEAQHKVIHTFEKSLETSVMTIIEALGNKLSSDLASSFKSSMLKALPEFKEFTTEKFIPKVEKGTKGFWTKALILGGAIAGVGFTVATGGALLTVAALQSGIAGASFASLGKGILGKSATTREDSVMVKTGDNILEIRDWMLKEFSGDTAKQFLRSAVEGQLNPFFKQIERFMDDTYDAIEYFEIVLGQIEQSTEAKGALK